jgi:hypothetical protein
MNDLTYEVGDVITTDNKESRLYRRECTVVCADKSMVGVITEGIDEVVFVPTTETSIKVLKKGMGYIPKETKALVATIMQGWAHRPFVNGLPKLIDSTRKSMEMTPEGKTYIKMDGFVPRELAMAWKQIMSLMDLVKLTDESTVPFIQTLMFEWMLTGALFALRATSEFHIADEGQNEEKK